MERPLEVVFVHLGTRIPEHLLLNMKRFIKLFPEIPVTLVTDQEYSEREFSKLLNIWRYSPDSNLDVLNAGRDISYRFGFWRTSIERFFAISKFHRERAGIMLLHVESDVLILPNFPWSELCSLETLSWNPYNSELDVAGLVLLPSWQHTENLVQAISREFVLDNTLNDMEILKRISSSQSPSNTYLRFSPAFEVEKEAEPATFPGVFDGACIGVWLTGQDPRNHFGTVIYHDNTLVERDGTVVNPAEYSYKTDTLGNIAMVNFAGVEIPLYNLHIHSKNVKLFGDNWKKELDRLILLSSNKNVLSEFKIDVLWSLLKTVRTPKSFFRLILTQKSFYNLLLGFKSNHYSLYQRLRQGFRGL